MSDPVSTSASSSSNPQSHQQHGINRFLTQNYRRAVEWESTPFSAGVVASVNAIFLIFWALHLSPLSLLCYAVAVIVVAGYGIKVVKGDVFGAPGATVEVVSRETVEKFTNVAYERLNIAVTKAREILLWANWKHSAAAVIALFVAGWLSKRVSAVLAVFLAVNYLLLKKPTTAAYKKYAAPHVAPYVAKASGYVEMVTRQIPSVSERKNKKM